jgi:ABC-type Fe2+-enterobactin transport system substrate-binding protein
MTQLLNKMSRQINGVANYSVGFSFEEIPVGFNGATENNHKQDMIIINSHP